MKKYELKKLFTPPKSSLWAINVCSNRTWKKRQQRSHLWLLFAAFAFSVSPLSVAEQVKATKVASAESTVIEEAESQDLVLSQSQREEITKEWLCEYCKPLKYPTAEIQFNLFDVSDEEFRFGHLNGFESGTHGSFDASYFQSEKDGSYFKSRLENLGLDSVTLNAKYGVWGRYQLSASYSEIPLRQYDNLWTPFENPGASNLVLLSDWSLLSGANAPLPITQWQPVQLESDWKKAQLKWRYQSQTPWDYQVKYHRIDKQGLREFSAAQIWNATYLPMPVEQQIDQLNAALSYQGESWWGSVSYYFSAFNNDNRSLTYANPYAALSPGGEASQLATEPDNTAYKIGLHGNYKFSNTSWIKMYAAYGSNQQDDSLLAYSLNPNLGGALPTASYNGEVNNTYFNLRYYSRLTSEVSIWAKYRYRDQDNTSDQFVYMPVVGDTFIGGEVTNLGYDYQKTQLEFGGDWRFLSGQLMSLSLSQDSRKRNFSEISKTDNLGVDGKLKLTHDSGLQFDIKARYFERDASDFTTVDLLTVTENPLLQRYNLADRYERKLGVQLFYPLTESLMAGLQAGEQQFDYVNSELGLQKNSLAQSGVDLNWNIDRDADVSIYYLMETAELEMAGSQNFASVDWQAFTHDKITSSGLSFSLKNLADRRLNISARFNHSNADTRITMISGNNDLLPPNGNRWTSLELKTDYRFSPQLSFQLRYIQDDYKSEDFALDGVTPTSVSNLLTLGAYSYDYQVDYFGLSVRYQWF